MFHKILEEANSGDQMGLLARGLKQSDVRRGMCGVTLKTVKQHDSFRAQMMNMMRYTFSPNVFSGNLGSLAAASIQSSKFGLV